MRLWQCIHAVRLNPAQGGAALQARFQTLLGALTVHGLHCCRWNAATGVVMSHEVARHVRYNVKLKALQHTPHHMIISRVRILLERLRDAPAAAPGSSKAVDEQVACSALCCL